MDERNWRILVVTGGKIVPEYYSGDSGFNPDRYVFFNVSAGKAERPEGAFG